MTLSCHLFKYRAAIAPSKMPMATEMTNTDTLQTELLALAEAYAAEYYGCDLSRLDSDHFISYCDRVTVANLDALAFEMAEAAWFEN